MFSKQDLLKRGWTTEMIRNHLRRPPKKTKATVKYWSEEEVFVAEKTYKYIKSAVNKVLKHQKHINELSEKLSADNPILDYLCARKLYRHFIINVGGTNTGKTYTALQTLKEAENGIYLAPLRLLAMEVQETLNSDGCLCSLSTGEEEDIIPGANFISATVEKLDIHQTYDVGVIDECQMLADEFRGGSWTRAILGLAASTIYLCMSEEALDICIQLIELCGDTYEIHKCERKVPLSPCESVSLGELQRGDAIVLFSRKKVLEYAAALQKMKFKVSCIYGALPYQSRKHEVEKYKKGQTDIIVTTDAIGMGLNLPIKRVLFAQDSKFDGKQNRYLLPQEIKQIAGRAGRLGMYDEGFYSTFETDASLSYIKKTYEKVPKSIQKVQLPFPEECINYEKKVSTAIQNWRDVLYPEIFLHTNTDALMQRAIYIEKAYAKQIKEKLLSNQTIYKLISVIFDENNTYIFHLWSRYVSNYINGNPILLKDTVSENGDLEYYERCYKEIDLYYSFCKNMELPFDNEKIRELKSIVVKKINEALLKEKKKGNKKCQYCGEELPPFYPFHICEDCYNSRYDYSYTYDRYW